MIRFEDLHQCKTVYMYNEYGQLKWCDIVVFPAYPTGFGFIHEDDRNTLYCLTERELEKMFYSREEAEQFDLFQLEEWE